MLLGVGCVHETDPSGNETLVFDFRSSDVAGAFAEDIDPRLLDTRDGAPHYEAQLRLLLSDGGVKRFQRFNKAHHGQTFELRVKGDVLLADVSANGERGPVRETLWFVGSMDEARRFADSLTTK